MIVNPNVEHTEVSYNKRPLEYIVLGVEGLEYSAGEDADERWFMTNMQNAREALLHALREMLREIEYKAVGYELICQDLLEVLILRLMRHAGLQFLPTKTEHRKPRPQARARSAPPSATISTTTSRRTSTSTCSASWCTSINTIWCTPLQKNTASRL